MHRGLNSTFRPTLSHFARGLRTAILLSLLLVLAMSANAQNRKDVAVVDTVQVPFYNGFAVHAEMVGVIQNIMGDHGQYEAGIRVNLKDRYFPAFEVGYGKADEEEDFIPESNFHTKAPYFRLGCDFNLLRNKHDKYKAFGGFRYGISHFNYDMTVGEDVTDDDGNTTTEYTQYNGLSATYHWLEGVFGVDAEIYGPFHLGWDVRYRRALANSHSEEGEPWYIPGFGNKKNAGFTACFNITLAF